VELTNLNKKGDYMSNDTQRLIIFILLSGAILFFYNLWFMPKPAQKTFDEKQKLQPTVAHETSTQVIKNENLIKTQKFISSLDNEKEYSLENELVKITFSTVNAVIKSYTLKNYSDKINNNAAGTDVELVPNKSSFSYLLLQSQSININKQPWKFEGIQKDGNYTKILFSQNIEKGVILYKEYQLQNNSYIINLNIKIKNSTKIPFALKDLMLSWGPNIHFLPQDMTKYKAGMGYQYNKVLYETKNNQLKIININLQSRENKTTLIEQQLKWLALKDIYFISSFLPENNENIKKYFIKENAGGFVDYGIIFNDLLINGNSEHTISINSFIGPQEYKLLKKIKMENAVDLGWSWLRPISIAVFYSLDFLYKLTKNYGVAIILLTIIIRAFLWIPSQNSYKHMKDMQKKMNIIKPRMETLKKIYKDDPQKLNEETMKLYQEYKINPLGGCLPMLLQLPIFFALYATLINMVELKGAYFALWLKDLSAPDPFFVLPILMGVTMLIQQKMSQTPSATPETETQQKILTYGMPVFLTFLAFSWPSGLLLYWSVSNILSILQQFFVNKSNI